MLVVLCGCLSSRTTATEKTVLAPDQTHKHFFILSGQSNMTGQLKKGFAQKVVKHYGSGNAVIAHKNKNGRGIRFWDKDYVHPKNYKHPVKGKTPSKGSLAQHGQEYGPLLEAVQKAKGDQSFTTVTFVWMQGESDAANILGDVYAESFNRIMVRLKKDIGLKELNFVIARISDAGLGGNRDKSWKRVREVQVELAEDSEYGAWIDTDDLNGAKNDVHYPSEQYAPLGERLADKAILLIAKRLNSVR